MISHANFLPNVEDVAYSFSQAAKNYDQVAGLQRLVADELITKGAGLHRWLCVGHWQWHRICQRQVG